MVCEQVWVHPHTMLHTMLHTMCVCVERHLTLTVLSSRYIVLDKKSIPIVAYTMSETNWSQTGSTSS